MLKGYGSVGTECGIPTTYDLSLASTNCYVVSNYHKLHAIGLARVKRRVLFFRKTKVQNITSVVPNSQKLDPSIRNQTSRLLDDDHSSKSY